MDKTRDLCDCFDMIVAQSEISEMYHLITKKSQKYISYVTQNLTPFFAYKRASGCNDVTFIPPHNQKSQKYFGYVTQKLMLAGIKSPAGIKRGYRIITCTPGVYVKNSL